MFWIWQEYKKALENGDVRVSKWLLMSAFWPTFTITAVYLAIVYMGPKIMKNYQPITSKWVLFAYNAALVVLNFHIFYELLTASLARNYSYTCQNIEDYYHPDEVRIANALWWYYFSKVIEYVDTMFFVLRKKNDQLSVLHVYHHVATCSLMWMYVKWLPGGQVLVPALINSFVHVIMYSYYGVSALGPRFQKYLWWKKYLTLIQLIQLTLNICHTSQALYFGCMAAVWFQRVFVIHNVILVILFLNFYSRSYTSRRTNLKVGVESHNHDNQHTNGQLHLANGSAISNIDGSKSKVN